jgi:DNA ligase (NAD+)
VSTDLTTREEYEAAVARAREAARAYYNSDTLLMDDATYDALAQAIARAGDDHPDWVSADAVQVTGQVAAGQGTGDVPHTVPMLSLDNVYSEEELEAWATSLTRALGHPATRYTVEPKMDGLAVAARYVDGHLTTLLTRGSGTAGEDVTHAAAHIVGLPPALPEPVTVEVRGEVMLTDAQFDRANDARLEHGDRAFANPRQGAAGALRGAKGRAYPIEMTFFAYAIVDLGAPLAGSRVDDLAHSAAMAALADLGISTTATSTAGMGVADSIDQVHAWISALIARRPTLGFGVDGAVVKADLPAERAAAGFSSRAPRWAIARKFPPDTRISVLRAIHWQVGRTGVVTPRAEIDPVSVGGTTITYATMHNPGDIERKGFLLGDHVTVLRAGEVIPRLEAPVVSLRTGAETAIQAPTVCPRCGSDLDTSQARWRCVRGRACGLAESIRYAASRDCWDIEGMGDRLVAQLVDAGRVGDVADLFTLTVDDLIGLDRMGATSAAKVVEQIDQARRAPLARTITALGIVGTGRSISRRLARHFGSMDALRRASVADLEGVDGIGTEKAMAIVAELDELGPVIDRLTAAGVAMADTTQAPAHDAPLAGMWVVVTGTMTGPLAALSRNQVNELIERAGGRASGSVSARTDLLVAGDKAGSKLAKAQSLGVRVIGPQEFADLVAAYL